MQKKSATDFLKQIIIPIEKRQVDKGNVYVLIKSSLRLQLERDRGAYLEYEESDTDMKSYAQWSLPKTNGPGNWQGVQSPSGTTEKSFKLVTLSGIVWHGDYPGNLYRVEYSGKSKRLELEDFVHYVKINLSAEQKMELEAQEYIDKCISLGMKVNKVRLVSRVENWTPFLLWSFAIDCVEHCYSSHQPLDSAVSKLYRDGILFARAYSRYRCHIGTLEIEQLLNEKSGTKDFDPLVEKRRLELFNKIKVVAEERDLSTGNLGRAVNACLEYTARVFDALERARVQNAWGYKRKYQSEYELPNMGSPKSMDEEKTLKRIWYALMKEELDWQVLQLARLV